MIASTVIAVPLFATLGATAAQATPTPTVICGFRDTLGVVHCNDGSSQYVDIRGWLIIKDSHGRIVKQKPPTEVWY